MSYLFLLLFLVCIFGVFKPFQGLKRWHFGLAAFVSFFMIGVTAPSSDTSKSEGATTKSNLSPAEAAATEKKNVNEIAKLKNKVAQIPASDFDENLRIYKELVALAPSNPTFGAKVSEFEQKIAARSRYEDHPEEALTIKDFDWAKGGFGSIMEISRLKIRNDAPFAIKDLVLRCVHQGNSGTDMDRNTRTIFEIVPANDEKTIRGINMGFISSQAVTSECEITSATKA